MVPCAVLAFSLYFSLILFVLCSKRISEYMPLQDIPAIFCLPFSFPALPSALLYSTNMFPFPFFNDPWLHHKHLLQPLKHLYSVLYILLCLYYFFVSPSLQTVFAFPRPSISILLSFFFCLCFFFFFRCVTFGSSLSRRCCVKHSSSGITLHSLTHIALVFLNSIYKINLCLMIIYILASK